MTILQKSPQRGRHARKGWYRFVRGDQAPRQTNAWKHQASAEHQARWQRSDPAYAGRCDEVRQANERGQPAQLRGARS